MKLDYSDLDSSDEEWELKKDIDIIMQMDGIKKILIKKDVEKLDQILWSKNLEEVAEKIKEEKEEWEEDKDESSYYSLMQLCSASDLENRVVDKTADYFCKQIYFFVNIF